MSLGARGEAISKTRLFTEFSLSKKTRFFALLRMTSAGHRMTN